MRRGEAEEQESLRDEDEEVKCASTRFVGVADCTRAVQSM